jgi:hypothetical protein
VPGSLVGEKEPIVRVTSRPISSAIPHVTAESLLGSGHPLARAEERHRSLRRQLAAVGFVLFGAAVVQLTGLAGARPLIIVAAMVDAALACSLLLVAKDERRLARELIVMGRETVPLRVVEWERHRLLDPSYRHRLAGSLDRIVRAVERRRWLLRGSRPLFRTHIVAAVLPDLAELARALRRPDCEAAGVAMVQRLLCDGESPLYGDNIILLRETVVRIRSRLGSSAAPAGTHRASRSPNSLYM